MEKVPTSKAVCIRLNIPFYKLQYLFDAGKIPELPRSTSGDRIYTEDDIKRIREALFKMM